MTAAAARRLLRVLELEPLIHERLLPLEHRAAEVDDALLVAEDADLAPPFLGELQHEVALPGLGVVELDGVAEPRAPAALDADADRCVRRPALGELLAH